MKKLVKKTLYASNPPLENISNFFWGMAKHAEKNGIKNGCLLVNTLLELSTIDKETHKAASEMFAELESNFAEVLTKAKEEGAISNDKNPETLAKILIVSMAGLRVYSKVNPNPQQEVILIDELISMLKR
jgi:TetR/AcrR family transcriptional repressor of nem operon